MLRALIVVCALCITGAAYGQCQGPNCRLLARVAPQAKVERSVLVKRESPPILRKQVVREVRRQGWFPRLRAKVWRGRHR